MYLSPAIILLRFNDFYYLYYSTKHTHLTMAATQQAYSTINNACQSSNEKKQLNLVVKMKKGGKVSG